MKSWLPLLYTLALYSPFSAGLLQLRNQSLLPVSRPNIIKKIPWSTLIIAVALITSLVLQIIFSRLLTMCMRNTGLVLKGKWWRILTALFFQDGGLTVGIANIVGLLFIGTVAEQFWTRRKWLIMFFVGGVLSELVALMWQPTGAGNSIANFCLAAGVTVICMNDHPSITVRITAILSLGVGILLFAIKDIHGAALMIGLIVAVTLMSSPGGESIADRFSQMN